MQKIHVGFIGAGGIARSHVYAIQALKFYYNAVPEIVLESVSSARKESREAFAQQMGFTQAQSVEDFAKNDKINAYPGSNGLRNCFHFFFFIQGCANRFFQVKVFYSWHLKRKFKMLEMHFIRP